MLGLGVIEGFFGPDWSWTARAQMATFLSANQYDFYLYAPKRDPYLRRQWSTVHPPEMWHQLTSLRSKFREAGVKFGVGLSPFELHESWDQRARQELRTRLQQLDELELDLLGLFFDDMKGSPDLAQVQAEMVAFVQSCTRVPLLFCPTYYSDDPILDKVFGARPTGYLERIGQDMDLEVKIFWTGSKVISPAITAVELKVVTETLRRAPLIWDNFFANDGPKQSQFLKLKPFEGRSNEAFAAARGWVLNPMNQPYLSQLVLAAANRVFRLKEDPIKALQLPPLLDAAVLMEISQKGLDHLGESTRAQLRQVEGPVGDDLRDWLDGKYRVGPECLTD